MIKSPENLIEMKHSKPVRIVSMLIDYIDIVYLLEKLFNAIYVFFFFLKIEETELYSTSRNELAFSNYIRSCRVG
jgi:hypothetical protein